MSLLSQNFMTLNGPVLVRRCMLSRSQNFRPTPRLTTQNQRTFFTFVSQFEKGVTLTFGKLTSVKEPGFRLSIPIVQEMFKVDLRTRIFHLLPQDIVTRDNVSVRVSSTMYYRVFDPEKSVMMVRDVSEAVHGLVDAQLRETLCHQEFSELLEQRETISKSVLEHTAAFSREWGVMIERVQLNNIDLMDPNMVRAMAKEAEATRDRKAAIIRADAEFQSAMKLADAAEILGRNPATLELRKLQTLEKIAKEKSQHTVVVPLDFHGQVLGLSAAAIQNRGFKNHQDSEPNNKNRQEEQKESENQNQDQNQNQLQHHQNEDGVENERRSREQKKEEEPKPRKESAIDQIVKLL